jgi:protein-tyrosine phosphatase
MGRFRSVDLGGRARGRLYLHHLPGRFEPVEEVWSEVRELDVVTVVCLLPDREIEEKSPGYAAALRAGTVPAQVWRFPIRDFGSPDDVRRFGDLARRAAERLESGDSILVHCAAGIGRTGMFATAVLLALGFSADEAAARVRAAGSRPERPEQVAALRGLARPE